MINDEDKPNPDELLKAIQAQEKQQEVGQLKIFFGMSAGVGKTFSMLSEARQRVKEGINVVVGTVNTHGRIETEELLLGLPIIPEKWVKYKDTVFEEMDLETIIDTKPELVIVDELAHTNVPGSKHPKRWQDVVEILDAGINVYTTLNVQHIESRKDLIEGLTGIQVRETVPDLILERATSMELIDIPPLKLLQRLHEGKVYLGDQSRIAAENFFKEENLTALREIALRFTAEKVDHDLHGILQGKGWRTRERLMVAISLSPSSEQLIRSARRLAFELDAPWVAVYVDTGIVLTDEEQTRLNRYFNLARELGAEVITTHDVDIASALQRVASQKDITRIVIGRPPKKQFSFKGLFQGSFIERLENDNKQTDIVILRQDQLIHIFQRSLSRYSPKSSWNAYGLATACMIGITALGFFVSPYVGYKSVGFIYLLGILLLSFFVGRGPIFFAAILSALFWDFLFIPPIFTPTITDPEDISLVIIYFIVAAIMGTLTSRMREQDQFLIRRQETTERLYEIERDIANATDLQYMRLNVCSRLEKYFPGKFEILIKGPNDKLVFDSQQSPIKTEKEKAAAIWVFQKGKVGGWSTDTLPSASGIYFPIKFSKATVGVLGYFPKRERPMSLEEINFIQTVNQHLGIYLERHIFEERKSKEDYSLQIERLHQSIFHSLNQSFRMPLDRSMKLTKQIQESCPDPRVMTLTKQMEQDIFNIKLTVDNIIAISELESGFVHFNKKQHAVKDLIEQSLRDIKFFKNSHVVKTELPSAPLFLPFDFNLLKLALNSLLLNALECSPASKPIFIRLEAFENEFHLSVLDEGPGIPHEITPLIFDKFYRLPGTSKGLGLGLAIVKAVVEIHQGKIAVNHRESGGTEFSLILPI